MIKRNIFALTALLVFFCINIDATRINPRVGRSVWRISRDSTPTPIEVLDEVSGIVTIDSPGNYQLYENLQNLLVVINSSNVFLDLNGYEVSHSDGTQNIITVNASNVKIYNGSINNMYLPIASGSGSGIIVNEGKTNITLENIQIFGCGVGVFLSGQYAEKITNCDINKLYFVSNTVGMKLVYSDENIIKNCVACGCIETGFDLLYSETNCLYDCQVLETIGTSVVSGFKTDSGQSNLFKNCIAKKTTTTSSEFCNKSYGFLLTGTEEKTKIIECIVNEVDMTSTVSAVSYGISLKPTLLTEQEGLLSQVTRTITDSTQASSSWSPDRRYFATSVWEFSNEAIKIYGFDEKKLAEVANFDVPNYISSVDWSSDGKYIVAGDFVTTGSLRVFDFNGSILDEIVELVIGKIEEARWSPNGKYIAVAQGTVGRLLVYIFDPYNPGNILTEVDSYDISATDANCVAWSPDGRYISLGDNDGIVHIFNFDGGNLTEIDNLDLGSNEITSIDWSPNGKFIAVGTDHPSDTLVYLLSFDGSDLIEEDQILIDNGFSYFRIVTSIVWSPDGKYIACTSAEAEAKETAEIDHVYLLSFDGVELSLHTQVEFLLSFVFSIDWSSDGKYFVICGRYGTEGFIEIRKAMYGPENCLIRDCSVCDTQSFGTFVGTGISGGGDNAFFKNVSCNNEVDFSFGIPNVFYDDHNKHRPFDNVSTPEFRFLVE